MSRFFLLARAPREPDVVDRVPMGVGPRGAAANEADGLSMLVAHLALAAQRPPEPPDTERSALWFWAEPSDLEKP